MAASGNNDDYENNRRRIETAGRTGGRITARDSWASSCAAANPVGAAPGAIETAETRAPTRKFFEARTDRHRQNRIHNGVHASAVQCRCTNPAGYVGVSNATKP